MSPNLPQPCEFMTRAHCCLPHNKHALVILEVPTVLRFIFQTDSVQTPMPHSPSYQLSPTQSIHLLL
ncbi:hypothetical protein XELAEV_18018070mg [Xenopus laevis]|uniref:Uncharacterized protein n=1 Tax=Xenopus laevis TaxID=8355 RepID=A0A974HTF6_XENLA|nr:hypothetical protein XELAEV_18018070mg [Xenopus laevis]